MSITLDEKCDKCNVNLQKTHVGKYSKFTYCISCPNCHVVFDLV